MSQRAIIAGGGHIGAGTAAVPGDDGHDPVVSEQDSYRRNRLEQSRDVVIEGDTRRFAGLDRRRRPLEFPAAGIDLVAVVLGVAASVCERVRG